MLEYLCVSSVMTPGGAHDWVVNDLEIDGISQLAVKDLPGALFTFAGIVVNGRRARSAMRFSGLVIERDGEVAVTVTYVGPNPEGALFFGAVEGGAPPQNPTDLPIATRRPVRIAATATIVAVLDHPLEIERLEIDHGNTKDGAADWIVNDIRVDGTTQLVSGDISGDLFATECIDTLVTFQAGSCVGSRIELDVTYIGPNTDGCRFMGRLLGMVVREDREQAPPDVHAIIRVGDDEPEEVIAHCNWRAPYIPAS